jgi:hypothetical protein
MIIYRSKTIKDKRDVFSLHLIDSSGVCDIELYETSYLLSPTWSPEGNSIAFIEPDSDGIFVANLEGVLSDNSSALCQ